MDINFFQMQGELSADNAGEVQQIIDKACLELDAAAERLNILP